MTRKIDFGGLLDRRLHSAWPFWALALLLLMPLVVAAGVLALVATMALAVVTTEDRDAPAVRAPAGDIGHLPEPTHSLTGLWEPLPDRAA